MNNTLGKNFNFKSLLIFTLPMIAMLVFMSLYTIVDGMFISHYVGSDALSGLNIVWPIVEVMLGFGVMISSGGGALVSKLLGEGQVKKANMRFTMFMVTGFIIGVLIMIIGLIFKTEIIYALGMPEEIFHYGNQYITPILIFAPIYLVKLVTESFFIVSGKPQMALLVTLLGGGLNILLDFIFIVPLSMGVFGAGLGTALSNAIAGIVGVIYFFSKKRVIHFTKFKFHLKSLMKGLSNGSSEFVTSIANGVMTFLFNIIMLKFFGVDGVAAITSILYFRFIASAIALGFSQGVMPVIGFNYGKGNRAMLRKIVKISVIFLTIVQVVMFALSMLFPEALVSIMIKPSSPAFAITVEGLKIFAYAFLLGGIGIFASSLFTGLSNGFVSALISFLRTFIFQAGLLVGLSYLLGKGGVWMAVPIAEGLTVLVSILIFTLNYKKYFEKKKCVENEVLEP